MEGLCAGDPDAFVQLLDEDVVLVQRNAGVATRRLAGRADVSRLLYDSFGTGADAQLQDATVGCDRACLRFSRPWWEPARGRLASWLLAAGGCQALVEVSCSRAGIGELICSFGPSATELQFVELSAFR